MLTLRAGMHPNISEDQRLTTALLPHPQKNNDIGDKLHF